MHLLELGLDHHTADVTVRERVAVPADDLPDVLQQLGEIGIEAAVISTCNRVEIYLLVEDPEEAHGRVVEVLAARSGLSADRLRSSLATHQDETAVRHLFRVACGLESMIIGEPEIAGQVRTALKSAQAHGTARIVLRRLFSDALSIAGRVRAESGISREPVSVSSTAVRLAERRLVNPGPATALVIGAGSVGRAVARALKSIGTGRILVASRRRESAEKVARLVGGQPLTLAEMQAGLSDADLVISATGAPDIVVTAEDVHTARLNGDRRPLLLIDIAVPRDLDPAIAQLDDCTLYDVDDLGAVRENGLAARRLQAEAASGAIDQAVERFERWLRSRKAAPAVTELIAHAEKLRAAEAERALARMGAVSERERQLVEAATAGLLKKLLHRPIVELKRRGASDEDAYLTVLRDLLAISGAVVGERRTSGRLPGRAVV